MLTLLFYTGLQLSFNTVIPHSTHSGNTCLHTNQKSWSGRRFMKSRAAVPSFQAAWLHWEGTRRRGREVCRSWGISRHPPVSSSSCCPDGRHRLSCPPCLGQTPPWPPWWRACVQGFAGWVLHAQSPVPAYSGVSFLAPCFGHTTRLCIGLLSFCLVSSVALKREALLT